NKLSHRIDRNGNTVEFVDSAGRSTDLSPAGQLLHALNKGLAQPDKSFDGKMIQYSIADGEQVAQSLHSPREFLFSGLVAMQLADEYLARFVMPETLIDRDGKEEQGRKEETEQAPKEKKKAGQSENAKK